MFPQRTSRMILAIAALTAGSLSAQGWTTWYSAYEDGLEAQQRGDPASALKAFQFASAQRPEPGAKVKTYNLNFISYYPYLKIAECALALGDVDRAERALGDSAKRGVEPASVREALQQRVFKAREAAKPKEPGPKLEPPKVDAPKPPSAETPKPATQDATKPEPLKPAPSPRIQIPAQAPAQTLTQVPVQLKSQEPQAVPPKQSTPSAPVVPLSTAPRGDAPGGLVAPATTASPATIAAPPPPLPWGWIGGGLGLIGLGVAAFALRRRSNPMISGITVKHPTNPYRVDLNANTGGGDVTRISARSADPQATSANRRVGPYLITKVLGRGGCATTYLAVHEEDGTEVAVKIPHPHIVIDPDFLARFRREAELGAVLDHPRIVRILDPGPRLGDAWIAMTLVRGTTLEAFLTDHDGPLSIAEVVHLAYEVAEAIAYAHSKGVVHRDLKPANVMIGELGAQVMDFGIARLLDASITSTTVFMGTPNYAAPEALVNSRVGPPADRYAMGIMLYEMLAGEVPFKGETTFHVLDMHRSAPLPDIRAIRPDAPPRLVRLVERLCMKAPDQRPEDGEVLHFLSELKREFPLAAG